MQRSGKLLDVGTANGAFPSLGLDVNYVEAQFVFLDDAVDALVTGLADRFPRVSQRSAIAHANEQLDDESLEKCRRTALNTFQELGPESRLEPLISAGNHLLGGGLTRLGQVGLSLDR